MRGNPSATEALLWRLLRDRRLHGLKFRRQVPIGRYVADFACAAHGLIVEADGPHHDPAQDAIRDDALRSLGWRVLRFPNAALTDARQQILNQIVKAARQDPSPSREKVALRSRVG